MKQRYFTRWSGSDPDAVIGYGIVIPRSCIAGTNDLTVGFATTVIGACATYYFGVRTVANDLNPGGS
jgi:hypothetical protein